MTLRRIIISCALSGAIATGAIAVPATAGASPSVASAPGYVKTGRDPLAVYADSAMNAYMRFVESGGQYALDEFASIRDAIALEAARRLGIDGVCLHVAWGDADLSHQVVLMSAMTQLGTPYRRTTSKPGVGFDCSGLTSWAWTQSGVALARQSRAQINSITPVTRDTAQAGDLVYYPGHVMLYLGVDDAVIHAPFTGRSVEFSLVKGSRSNSLRFGNPLG